MSRCFGLLAVLVVVGAVNAEAPAAVADLVKQLGDPKFTVREAAQKELLKRGEGIVPELQKLAKTTDPESVDRIGKVLYTLVGYKGDILRLLAGVHEEEEKNSAPVPVSDELRGLVGSHQPGSGDLLVAILAQPGHRLYRRALKTFVSTWDYATPEQIDTYLQQAVRLTSTHRAKFPARIGAMISVEAQLRDGWAGWTSLDGSKTFDFRSRTSRYLDGKPYDKPFNYPYPFATVGWYKIGELAEGKHTIHAVMEYELTQRGMKRKGEIRSKESQFEVLPADSRDELIAPASDALTRRVRSKFTIRESEHDPKGFTGYQPGTLPAQGAEYHWFPQVTWKTQPTEFAGIHCPIRMMSEPLDVDLCFDVEIQDLTTKVVYPADPIVIRAGQVERNWIVPRDVRAFAKGREGFVRVKVVLKPSRASALTDPKVTRYFPDTITSDELRMKVYQKVEPVP